MQFIGWIALRLTFTGPDLQLWGEDLLAATVGAAGGAKHCDLSDRV